MISLKDVSSDVTPAKALEVKPIEAPKEIGEDKSRYVDAPREIGETSEKAWDIPKEIGENDAIQPNTVYEVDGEKHYTDDNGDVYRVNKDLVADNTYEINGYKYEADNQGRIVSAEGKLQLKNRDRLTIKDNLEDIGKGDEKAMDDRGHIIGDQFNGSNGMENIVAQDAICNRVDYYGLEAQLAKEVSAGKDVHMRVDLDYPGKSYRPGSFMVSYSVNGEEFTRTFFNDPRGEVK